LVAKKTIYFSTGKYGNAQAMLHRSKTCAKALPNTLLQGVGLTRMDKAWISVVMSEPSAA